MLVGEVATYQRRADEPCKFRGKRLPIRGASGVDLRLDRLGEQGEGEAASGEATDRKGCDRGCERRERTWGSAGGAVERGHFPLGKHGGGATTISVLEGK